MTPLPRSSCFAVSQTRQDKTEKTAALLPFNFISGYEFRTSILLSRSSFHAFFRQIWCTPLFSYDTKLSAHSKERYMDQRHSQEVSGDPIPEPEPAHLSEPQSESEDSEREATELRSTSRPRHLRRIISPGTRSQKWYEPFWKFWRHHVRVSVPHVDCRDHLGKLKRCSEKVVGKWGF